MAKIPHLGDRLAGRCFFVYGEAVAKVLTEILKIDVNPLPTQGSVHNVKLIESGGAQLGLLTMGVGLQGWNGTGDWTSGQRYRKMRALFPMYDSPLQFVTLRRSGITTVAQLNNRNVGVGPRAGPQAIYVQQIFSAIGISAKIGNGSFNTAAAGLQIETIRKAMPELTISEIGSGAYSSLDKTYTTLGVYNFTIGRDDLPDDLVYQLVKAVFENQPLLLKATSAASDALPQNAVKDSFLPFHSGAVRYYREVGIKIPDALAGTH